MSRFKKIKPFDFTEWFLKEEEKNTLNPGDYNLPFPWISMFVYTHIKGQYWGWKDDFDEENRPRILQIGCAQGWDAVEIAKILKMPHINGELHVIDWFKGNLTVDKEEEWTYNEDNPPIWKNHLWSEAKKFKVEDRIQVFEGDSRHMIHNMKHNYYDMIFIDGGHEYEIVKSDIENSYTRLKSGGVVILDDFTGGRGVYDKYDIGNLSSEILEKDTHIFDTGEKVHCGVVKAAVEFFKDELIIVESHSKAYHIKK